jgi:hypothetical protein
MKNSEPIAWPEMPDCGVYRFWPEAGYAWIHPDDVAVAESWIPSDRVFRRHSFDGVYYRLQYGDVAIRVKPTLWIRVPDEHLWVGDQVEILGDFRTNEPSIASISEVRYDQLLQRIVYTLVQRGIVLDRPYVLEELRGLTSRPQLFGEHSHQVIDVPPDDKDIPMLVRS